MLNSATAIVLFVWGNMLYASSAAAEHLICFKLSQLWCFQFSLAQKLPIISHSKWL